MGVKSGRKNGGRIGLVIRGYFWVRVWVLGGNKYLRF